MYAAMAATMLSVLLTASAGAAQEAQAVPTDGVWMPPPMPAYADAAAAGEAQGANPFGFPAHGPNFRYSRGIHCDVLKHLKTPRTYRRLDAYMRPSAFVEQDDSSEKTRDFATGNWGGVRQRLYDKGIDIYGCIDFDYLKNIKNNWSDAPAVDQGKAHYDDERNWVQVYGLDLYSRLWSKKNKGGQIHASFTWPETRPMYAYGNRLNPTGTDRIHGQMYTEIGLGDPTDLDQGFRLFELWYQQAYGKNNRNYIRFGNIFPIIQISRSIASDLFNIWTFTEPCMLGTTYFTGNAPCYPQAPLGVQVYQILSNTWEVTAQVQQGYYASSGRNNVRGVNWNIKGSDGIETMTEFTRKGGTYSLDPNDNGKPWFLKLGVQTHSGPTYSLNEDVNGDSAGLSGLGKRTLHGNAQVYAFYEGMLYREPGSYGEGLTAYVKAGTGFWHDRNVVHHWVATGLDYEGLFPKRTRDVLYGGWSFVRASDGFVAFQTDNKPCRLTPGCVIDGRQDMLEGGYSAELRPWLFATGFVQYYHNPNTRSDLGNISSWGITTKVAF
jgi:carbohydrate-selective porin OprB